MEEWGNPSTPPERLQSIANKDPRAFMNPNMSFEGLVDGAKVYPLMVEKNPAVALYSLESPDQAKSLAIALATGWREMAGRALPKEFQRSYAIDCAEHVLHIFESLMPGEDYPRRAIALARRYMDGVSSQNSLVRMGEEALDLCSAYEATTDLDKARDEALNAAVATISVSEASAARRASAKAYNAAGFYAVGTDGYSSRVFTEAASKEALWQANRARHYYKLIFPEYETPDLVGGVPKWNDPKTKPEDLLKQALKRPEAYTNPNFPIKQLIDNAHKYPWFAEKNPVLGLLSIEDPANYAKLLAAIHEGWVTTAAQSLSITNQRRLVIDCASRVLPIFESAVPGDKRPREAILAATDYLQRKISAAQLGEAFAAANLDNDASEYRPQRYIEFGPQVESAAEAASYAALPASAYKDEQVAWHALMAATAARATPEESRLEQNWQVNRVRHYYAMEHPEYQAPDTVGGRSQISVQKKATRASGRGHRG
jgi:hypothetical protein